KLVTMTDKAQITGIAPQLIAPDVVQTAEYYRDIFGFVIIGYAMQPPAYAMVQRDGFQIHFAKGDEFTPNEKYRKETTDIVIYVPEIENFYNEIKVNNAEIIMELT